MMVLLARFLRFCHLLHQSMPWSLPAQLKRGLACQSLTLWIADEKENRWKLNRLECTCGREFWEAKK